jgi:murein DD-endopeptidase MepM/ murein hydrolase activator NlpD
LATLHHRTARPARPLLARSGARRRAGLIVAGLTAAVVALPLVPADAAPASARSERDELAARVEAIEDRVERAEDALQRMTVEAEAAADAVMRTRVELARAESAASTAAEELAAARDAVAGLERDVATLGREAYMGDDAFDSLGVLLDSGGPGEVLQRAATLDLLGKDRVETLRDLEDVEIAYARAERVAREALARRDAAADAAAEAQDRADERVADAQREFDAMTAEKKELDDQLRRAEVRLLEIEGARDAAAEQARNAAAEEAAEAAAASVRTLSSAGGGAVAPATGRVTSCYGPRWGTMHSGLDIAAPIGTPIFAPEAGVVVDAGPASGFGQAVYVEHADGTITLYGHVNRFFVSPGQTVTAGQQIAEVGNRGQSTGPHLHFEVHTGGLYANRVNPTPWLTSRGISIGGC